jgi:hypothetical protein
VGTEDTTTVVHNSTKPRAVQAHGAGFLIDRRSDQAYTGSMTSTLPVSAVVSILNLADANRPPDETSEQIQAVLTSDRPASNIRVSHGFELALVTDPEYAEDMLGHGTDVFPNSPLAVEWIDVWIGAFGASGDLKYLSRIVRASRHRDGSSEAIHRSSMVSAMLQFAVENGLQPKVVVALSNLGFGGSYLDAPPDAEELADMRKLNIHAGMTITAQAIEEAWTEQPIANSHEYVRPEGLVNSIRMLGSPGGRLEPEPVIASCAGAEDIEPDYESGNVSISGVLVSISHASEVSDALRTAVRKLILPLPFEGWQWDDFAGSAGAQKSILFTVDTFEAERIGGLIQPNRSASLFVIGEVHHLDNGQFGAIVHTGERITTGRMPITLNQFRLLNSAKCAVAKAVHEFLKSLPEQRQGA